MLIVLNNTNDIFDLSDWHNKDIKSIYAGANTIMAITNDGEVLQQTTEKENEFNPLYWRNIKEIAISNWLSAAAIGLKYDGTCVITRKPIYLWIQDCYPRLNGKVLYKELRNKVHKWKNVKQVVANDAFFALHEDGTVSYVTFHCSNDLDDYYEHVKSWTNIEKIIAGYHSIYGIRTDGTVVYAGITYHKDNFLDKLTNIKDLVVVGYEYEDLIYITNDHKIHTTKSFILNDCDIENIKEIIGYVNNEVLVLTHDQKLYSLLSNRLNINYENVVTYAMGHVDYGQPFVVSVIDN